ncbi:MAG: HTH domain-containing protein [Bacteroidota bacterium]|nr:HTH domain-containing protein [Bacteroidota bacterium]
MTINKYLNRIKLLDQLIRQQNTGTPKELALKLGLGERQVYNLIEELKEMGTPVQYSRCLKTYYYEHPVKLNINFYVEHVEC